MGTHISKDVFDHLLNHMLDIHRKKINIISAYTLNYDSYTSKLKVLNSYIKGIEAFLETALTDSADSELPFVILNSIVCVRGIGKGEKAKIKIVLPKEQNEQAAKDVTVHSCFSDWGHALLLKKAGDHFKVGQDSAEYVAERIEESIRPNASPREKV